MFRCVRYGKHTTHGTSWRQCKKGICTQRQYTCTKVVMTRNNTNTSCALSNNYSVSAEGQRCSQGAKGYQGPPPPLRSGMVLEKAQIRDFISWLWGGPRHDLVKCSDLRRAPPPFRASPGYVPEGRGETEFKVRWQLIK